jgi:hypothetical protein
MSSAVEAAAARQKQAADAEAKELNKIRQSELKGEIMAGPSMKPPIAGITPAADGVAEPPAKARKLNDTTDSIESNEQAAKAAEDAKQKAEEDERAKAEALLNRPKWYSKIKSAQWWYYQDALRSPQGPFYPGQMRDWFTQGYFTQDHPVAPSFQGEMPQSYSRIVEAFPHPIYETAFVPGNHDLDLTAKR